MNMQIAPATAMQMIITKLVMRVTIKTVDILVSGLDTVVIADSLADMRRTNSVITHGLSYFSYEKLVYELHAEQSKFHLVP